ncbi:hypothetical protein WJX74_005630 [Apatococcus lobatus]|uniref:Uncharacterized protein n=2 Tax=Apatococcus TaxID=904362 RepID=A0AAW1SQ64_9CHLO
MRAEMDMPCSHAAGWPDVWLLSNLAVQLRLACNGHAWQLTSSGPLSFSGTRTTILLLNFLFSSLPENIVAISGRR